MPESAARDDGDTGAEGPAIVILVMRSGGIAGLRRRWEVAARGDDEGRWTELLESCPWDDPAPRPDGGADRFTWSIRARMSDDERVRDLPESAVTGAWRDLIDAVRAASHAPERE
ncbi:protealysin inhibitor emfourin [Microbacterium sp.]|uniref:protealysin inhibitor emfourin n=1 Tax=Microbacterium sp. TaxID=51671 RepID=UPI003342D9EE